MADDPVFAGLYSAGRKIASDDIGGVDYLIMKLAHGAADSATLVSAASGLPVNVVAGATNTQYTEGETDASITGTALLFEGAADTLIAAPGTAADGLLVNLGPNNDVVEASAAAIAASLSVMDDWDNAASDGASVSGDVAHDSSDAGEPVKIGYKAYSPDGTTPGTAVAENDRTNGKSDLDGLLYNSKAHPRNWSFHADSTSAVQTDASIAGGDPGDGFAVFITDIIYSNGAATASSVFIEEGATKILGPYYTEAIAGRGFAVHFMEPKRCTASTAVTVSTTGSVTYGLDVLGFIAAV